MSTKLTRVAAAALAVATLPVLTAAASAKPGHSGHGLAQVRAATAKYFSIQAAERDGYGRPPAGPLHYCIDEDLDTDDANRLPAMGYHWVNGALVDGTVSARHPEALVYEPTRTGRLQLVAVEYVVPESAWGPPATTKPPQLFGHDFMYVGEPNRYEIPAFYALHAWVWKHNPDGTFASMNPSASCVYSHLNQ
jgi:hypothetical protein